LSFTLFAQEASVSHFNSYSSDTSEHKKDLVKKS
jgi:hypothetical protein